VNINYLSWVCRVGLLGLIAAGTTLIAKPAEANIPAPKSLEIEANTIGNAVKVASTQNDAQKLNINQAAKNLNASSLELVKVKEPLTAVGQQQQAPLALEKKSANTTVISSETAQENTHQPVISEPAKLDNTDSMGQINGVSQLSNPQETNAMGQVTNVSQLRDVQPSDWAFEALRSLVERYGCIAGYPDGTFRGNRAMSRFEFAAGLNSCLNQVERLISSSSAGFATKEDLATLQRLVNEFRPELTTLGTRVDKLEGRTAFLDSHQFSTTTKLSGQAIIAAIGASGGAPNGKDGNIILTNRVRLNLQTSFTGKDTLITGLQAYNFGGSVSGAGSLQNTLFPSSTLTEGMTKLSFEPQFAGFDPKNLSDVGSNSVNLYKLLYIFPVAKKVTLFAGTAAEVSDAFPAVTPFADEGQEALSRFAGYNPVVRVSGGTSGTGLASAAGFIFNISDKIDLRALYGSVNANLPGNTPSTPLGSGLFSGSSVIAAQLTLKPTKALDVALNYSNSYHQINILGIGSSRASADALGLGVGNLGVPVKLNSFGATATFRVTPKISLSGYGAYILVRDSTSRVNASSDYTSWMVGLHFKDLLKEGNTAGLIFGQPLFRVDAGGQASLDEPGARRATPYHLEGYYRYQLTNNVSITPGAFVLFNPEGDSRNDTTVVGVVRTTFSF
jgi:hypothetical protein